MAISQKSVGTWAASNATTQTVTLPTHAAGDMLIVRAGCKPYTAAPVINTTGWTAVATAYANGATANGVGVGSVIVRAWWKIAASSSETNPVVTWGTTSAPGAAVAVCYQKASTEDWDTPVGAGGGDDTARTSQTATIGSHISVTAGDMVDFFVFSRDDSVITVPTITQTGVTYGTVSINPATALADATSNDCAASGGYRLASSGTSSAAAVVTHTNAATESGAAWQTRLRVVPQITQGAYRFYGTGTESGSTALAAQDTAYAQSLPMQENLQLRVRLQSAGTAGVSTDDYKLQYRIDSGSWTDVGLGTEVTPYNDPSLTHGNATTNRLGAGTGSFVAGEIADTSDTVTDLTITASNYTELLYSLSVLGWTMNTTASHTLEFRVLRNGATTGLTYSVTPTINVTKVPSYVQEAFRFYEDGTESASVAIAAQNTDITRDLYPGNSNLQLRIRMTDNNNFTNPSTDDWTLQYNKNSAGWTDVGTGAVVGYNSASLTEGEATTDRLGSGAIWETGAVSEDGVVDNRAITANEAQEFLYSITVVSASVANNDVIDFRVVRNSSTTNITYNVTPTITVSKVAPYSFEETFDDTAGTSITSGNSLFDIFNGSGTKQYVSTPAPINGSTCAAFDGTGGNASWIKDSSSLPGSVNGGTALKKIWSRFYVRASVAPSAITRIHIFEESVAAGGADIGGLRLNATGAFAIMDSTTSRGASTRTISTTEWTRVELMLDQDNDTITARLWWGADLHNASTGATNYETWTGTLNINNNDFQVFGIGTYATGGATIVYVDELKLSNSDWVGPATITETTQTYFGIPMD